MVRDPNIGDIQDQLADVWLQYSPAEALSAITWFAPRTTPGLQGLVLFRQQLLQRFETPSGRVGWPGQRTGGFKIKRAERLKAELNAFFADYRVSLVAGLVAGALAQMYEMGVPAPVILKAVSDNYRQSLNGL